MNEYFKLQDMGISIWKRFISNGIEMLKKDGYHEEQIADDVNREYF